MKKQIIFLLLFFTSCSNNNNSSSTITPITSRNENTSSYLAKHSLDSFNKYHTFSTRGIKKNNNFYELKNSKAKNKALIEFLFHDKTNEASFIINNYDLLATSIYETFINIINEL